MLKGTVTHTMVVAACMLAGCSRHQPVSGHRVLYYYDPMHPSYRSDKPGIAPDCNMALVPRYADEAVAGDHGIHLTSSQERLSGITTVEAKEQGGSRELRVPAKVVPAEPRRFRVTGGADGLIRAVQSIAPGTSVRRGQLLATYISRDVSTPQQGYLYALDAVERAGKAPAHSEEQLAPARRQLEVARDTLTQLGLSESDIEEVGRTRSELREFRFTSPVDGIVTMRSASPGMRFSQGEQLFEVASIESVWIEASVFASDARALANLGNARILAPNGTGLAARRVTDTEAVGNEANGSGSLALLIRLEARNPARQLLPGMYVTAVFDLSEPSGLVLPVESTVESGSATHVFVRRADGAFEARRVTTGWRSGGMVQITEGLKPHEVVARSGVFLLDSESQIRDGNSLR